MNLVTIGEISEYENNVGSGRGREYNKEYFQRAKEPLKKLK